MLPTIPHPAARRAFPLVTLLAVGLAVTACSKSGDPPASGPPGPSAEEMPALLNVASASVIAGFERGHLRQGVQVDAFRVTKHPITVAQYRACLTKGACKAPSMRTAACVGTDSSGPLDRATYDLPSADGLPVTCATVEQSASYCAWLGGALPTSEQWMLAVRGPFVARFAWGNQEPTCEQQAAADGICAPHVIPRLPVQADVLAAFAVGGHASGASPSGVEDVLLAPGEMLAASDGAFFSSCAPPNAACVAYGIRPGAIDSVMPIATRGENEGAAITTSTFRCVLREVNP
jgi:hypothetical protein